MRRLIIHAGTHKTGTTTLQCFLDSNKRALRKGGILYPTSGRPKGLIKTGHHLLAWSLVDTRYVSNMLLDKNNEGLNRENWMNLRKEIDEWTGHTTLISSEDFEYISLSNADFIRNLFSDHKIHVIMYFRKPTNYLKSLYAEFVRSGMFYGNIIEFIDYSINFFQYYNKANTWLDAGIDCVDVRHFDHIVKSETGLINDFVQLITPSLHVHETDQKNSSPPINYRLLARINQLTHFLSENKRRSINNSLINFMMRYSIFQNSFNFSKEEKNKLRKEINGYIEQFRNTFVPSKLKQLYYIK